jgi:subtilisin family serine protease
MANPSKIHPQLTARLQTRATATATQQSAMGIIVKHRPNTAMSTLASIKGVTGTHYQYHLLSASALSATPNAIYTLSDRDDVEMIWYDKPVRTFLDVSVPLIGAPRLWQTNITGKGIKVGIVDTGIDPTHPDLVNRIAQAQNFTNEDSYIDNHGHGTHVAGIIGGTGAASGGATRELPPNACFISPRYLTGVG